MEGCSKVTGSVDRGPDYEGTNPEERGPSICNIIARVTCMELRLTNIIVHNCT